MFTFFFFLHKKFDFSITFLIEKLFFYSLQMCVQGTYPYVHQNAQICPFLHRKLVNFYFSLSKAEKQSLKGILAIFYTLTI